MRHALYDFVDAGAVAQLGERQNRTLEAGGSIPLCSTNDFNGLYEHGGAPWVKTLACALSGFAQSRVTSRPSVYGNPTLSPRLLSFSQPSKGIY
jgi:hypothetical protein